MATVARDGDVDLAAFMDVVKLLTCKACSFRTTSQEEFLQHVRSQHVAVEPQGSSGQDSPTVSAPRKKSDSAKATSPTENSRLACVDCSDAASDPSAAEGASPLSSTSSSVAALKTPTSLPASSKRTGTVLVSESGMLEGVDSGATLSVNGSTPLLAGSAGQGAGGGGEGVNYVLMPENMLQRQETGSQPVTNLIQLQMPEGMLSESGAATSIGIGDVQVSHQQIQQILEAAKSSALSLSTSGGNQISLIPVGVGSQNSLAVSNAAQQFAIISTDDANLLTLTNSVVPSDIPTSLTFKTVQGLGLSGAGSQGEALVAALPGMEGLTTLLESGRGSGQSVTTTQEILGCGDCQMGFVSKKDFLQHVKQNHPNSNLGALSSALQGGPGSELSARAPSISVGTQMQHKKPGRKRKSEMAVKEEHLAMQDDSDDEDWKPGITESGRRKRKSRAPRGLREDYYLENRQRKRRQMGKLAIIEEYTLKCSVLGCMAKFRTTEALDLHTTCHNAEDQRLTCSACREPFEYWKSLRLHLWREHQLDADLFKCSFCPFKTDTCHKLNVHMEIHSDSRPYTCDVCGKGFKQFSQMRNHQVIHAQHHSDDPSKWYSDKKCSICDRKFANSKCLKKHVQAVHSNEKPFACPHCPHRASRKAMMELHIRTHTGEKPFQCDVCPYASGDHNSLRRHKMRHTGLRKYKCPVCSYSCIQAISLKTHMSSKHPGQAGVYSCSLCSFRTVNQQSFLNHQSDHQHGIVTTSSRKKASRGATAVGQQAPQQGSMVVVAAEDAQVSEVIEVPEAVQVQLSVSVKKDGTTTVPDHEYRRLVELEPVLELSAQNFLQYAMAAISAAASTSDQLPRNASMQLANGSVQAFVVSTEGNDCTHHVITFTLLNPALRRGDVQDGGVPAEDVDAEGAGEEEGEDDREGEEAQEGEEQQVLYSSEVQTEGQQGGQQVLYVAQAADQEQSDLQHQGQGQNVTLEFTAVACDGEMGTRLPGVVAMDTETVQMENIESRTSASDSVDGLAASPSSA